MSTERRAPTGDGLVIVGVVGRAGSGKSLVADALAQDGAVVLSGDEIGHEVTDHDPEVRAGLIAEYGAGVYHADGTLDRARVAARVFQDPEARARLDRLVHPRLSGRIRDRIAELRTAGFRGVVVIDAALLLEWGLERDCDFVIAVTAPEEEQVARLGLSRGWRLEQARARLASQRTQESFATAADVTLENRGTQAELVAAARAAVERYIARRAAPDPINREEPC